jgi:hypothetical protein
MFAAFSMPSRSCFTDDETVLAMTCHTFVTSFWGVRLTIDEVESGCSAGTGTVSASRRISRNVYPVATIARSFKFSMTKLSKGVQNGSLIRTFSV